ncbi:MULTISPECIES: SRPBCC family protein [Streptomyces]|uniref:SRPBCC family protein n=1 Tax=Streptomyces TaxID=1883 RepID=UPI001F60539B|nr:SRPBCC family protein [Streptomyces sp. MMS20-AI2-20]MCI4142331.1 carbon monoxide dehydrogenase [Streptomyces sp. MMS20-AI2-20]
MEHEVFVPVEAERLREVLDDPARVARAVPGLQHDAGAEPVTGRLKVRIGGSSITYRGTVRVSARDDGSYAVEGEAAEARGNGTVRLSLRLTPRAEDAGTALVVTGTATADGRVTELPRDAVTSAVTRLLSRFAENLGAAAEETPETPAPPESPEHLGAGDFEPGVTTDFETTPDAEDPAPPPERASAAASGEDEPTPAEDTARDEPASEPSDATPDQSAPEPPHAAPEPLDAGVPAGIDGRPLPGDDGDDGDDSLAEAAHARRTMIGRSAEEVDHAPPRGRYAPVPAPQTVTSPTPLRWAAPAAALAVASAVVAIRALRRRR